MSAAGYAVRETGFRAGVVEGLGEQIRAAVGAGQVGQWRVGFGAAGRGEALLEVAGIFRDPGVQEHLGLAETLVGDANDADVSGGGGVREGP